MVVTPPALESTEICVAVARAKKALLSWKTVGDDGGRRE